MSYPTRQRSPGDAPDVTTPPHRRRGATRLAGWIGLAAALVIALVIALVVALPSSEPARHRVRTPVATGPSAADTATAPAEDGKIHRASRAAGTPCVSVPHSCGYPDVTSTGVPTGTALRPSGSLTIDTAGATVHGLDITGSLHISAPGVTVRDVRVRCTAGCQANFLVRIDAGLTGVLVEDSELVGSSAVHTGIGGGGAFTARRINVHDVNDGVHLQSATVLEDSYIHNLAPTVTVHADTVQIIDAHATHVTIRHNTLLPFDSATLVYDNSAIICGSQCLSTTNLLVEDNLMDGGSQTLKCPSDGLSGNIYRDNVFGRDFRFAPVNGACGAPGNTFTANTFDGSGAPVVPGAGKKNYGG